MALIDPATGLPVESASQVQQQTKPSLPTVEETIQYLEALAASWLKNFTGKTNYNPFLHVKQKINPLLEQLKKPEAALTPQLAELIKALPKDVPPIDPNWKPEVTGALRDVRPSAKEVGALNAGT